MSPQSPEGLRSLWKSGKKDEIPFSESPKEEKIELSAISSQTEAQELFGPEIGDLERANLVKFDLIVHGSQPGSETRYSVHTILDELSGRKVDGEIPVDKEIEQGFLYQRNLQLAEEGKGVAMQLRDELEKPPNDARRSELLQKLKPYLGTELKKAAWLQKEVFPKLFESAVAQARGDVMQFLIAQANLDEPALQEIRTAADRPVHLKDTLVYALDNPEHGQTAGLYKGSSIDIPIPSHFSKADEWSVYITAVHELSHSVSTNSLKFTGTSPFSVTSPGGIGLNEAVTELMTFAIVSDHVTKGKKTLGGLDKGKTNILRSPYADYITEVSETFGKIPPQMYIDAALTTDGVKILSDKFDEEFGEGALVNFANKLSELRN